MHEAQPLIVKELIVLRDKERTTEYGCRVDEVSHYHEHVAFVEQELSGKLTDVIFLLVAFQLQATFLVTVPWRQQDKFTKVAEKLAFERESMLYIHYFAELDGFPPHIPSSLKFA